MVMGVEGEGREREREMRTDVQRKGRGVCGDGDTFLRPQQQRRFPFESACTLTIALASTGADEDAEGGSNFAFFLPWGAFTNRPIAVGEGGHTDVRECVQEGGTGRWVW